MKSKLLKITLATISIAVLLCILTGCIDTTENTTNTVKENIVTNNTTEAECEHDWVITSRYSLWADAYKTISKCSKCGKTVE